MNIFYINQVGTTNYLLPLFYYLKERNKSFYIIIQKKAFINEINNFNFLKITKKYKIKNCFKKILKKKTSNIILSATADYNEKKLILFAKKNKIKSTSVIDIWTNYKERFIFKKKQILPDKILCIDNQNIVEMKKLNFPLKKLQIIGSPFLERFLHVKSNKGKNILFISQPISTRIKNPNYSEYDFYDLIKKLLDYKKINNLVHLLLHPEQKNDSKFLKKYFKGYKIKIFSKININHNDYFSVIGMFSTELIKYYMMKKKVIIYDIDNNNQTSLLARLKMVPVVKNEKKLYNEIIKKKIFNIDKTKNFLSLKGSLERLAKYLYKYESF